MDHLNSPLKKKKKKFSSHDFLQLLLLDYKSNWILNGKWQILLSGKSGEMVFIQSKCTQTRKITQAQKNSIKVFR